MILPIVTHPNPILTTPTVAIAEITPEIHQLVADMRETMHNAKGLGLAAPQINRGISLCILEFEDPEGESERGEAFPFTVLINPRITWQGFRQSVDEEACLSIPGVYGDVKRPSAIRVKALNLDGETVQIEARGLFARAIQHEIDHLNGKLFTSYVTKKNLGTRPAPDYPRI
ncbi:peptide deformylase [soil metagenome]